MMKSAVMLFAAPWRGAEQAGDKCEITLHNVELLYVFN